jgi:DNA-binding LytR/AlgR family response regulator
MARRRRATGAAVKLRVIVVDDEPLARARLAAMADRVELVEVVGEAGNAIEAAELIARHDPDVALLDVRMPGKTGVELARELGERPVVVFTTAFGEHAVEAFDAAAIDYLMKPVEQAKLARALDRARSRIAGTTSDREPRITVRDSSGVRVFAASAITRFHAEDKYTAFVADGTEQLTEETLDALETRLAAWGFMRVHRAELVQLARIRALHVGDGAAEIELDDGQRAKVSRRSLAVVRRRLES